MHTVHCTVWGSIIYVFNGWQHLEIVVKYSSSHTVIGWELYFDSNTHKKQT